MARVGTKSSSSSRYQPFTELQVSWTGRGELKSLKSPDLVGQWPLLGRSSVCGLYLNELILYLLPKELEMSGLYAAYRQALSQLVFEDDQAKTLRAFEKLMLEELGYLPPLSHEHEHGSGCFFSPSQGVSVDPFPDSFAVSPAALDALAQDKWNQQSTAKEIKMMLTACIDRLLNGKPLRSRELIRSMSQISK